jgi:hypothetical protein
MLHGGKARPLEAGVFALPWGWLVPNCIITSSNSVYPASPRPDASKGYTRAWLGDQYTNQAQQKVQLKELLMGAAKPPSFRTPTFIRDMFDQSLDFILSNSWPDCLDVEFGENHISPGALLGVCPRIRFAQHMLGSNRRWTPTDCGLNGKILNTRTHS